MKKDETVFLKHMLESIEKIEEFTEKISKKEFIKLKKEQSAVIRELEVIGEAAKNVKEFRKKYPEVPWGEMSKTRDKLIHRYFGVDLNITWDIVKKDLPDLKRKIKKILKEVKK